MDFVSEITKNQQRQQEINTALKHTEKDYQQSLKELQKKTRNLLPVKVPAVPLRHT